MPKAPELRLSPDDLISASPPSLIVESIVASISQNSCITLMPDETHGTDPAPLTAFDCIDLEARDFPRAASYLLFQDSMSSKIVAELHVFYCPYVHFIFYYFLQ